MPDRTISLRNQTLDEQITTACILEASARKPGNVHPQADFQDLTYEDFIQAAAITGKELGKIAHAEIGKAILDSIRQMRSKLGTNVNLGIVLLLAPLAAIPREKILNDGIRESLEAINLHQTGLIYQAIRIANPGGIGEVKHEDVANAPTISILESMKLAAERDFIARQYSNEFREVLYFGRERFLIWDEKLKDWELSTVGTYLELMATYPDSLIARKCGNEIALESSQKAREVLELGWPKRAGSRESLRKFDQWLRADGHRRNPGTSADVIAAVLFSLIRDEMWSPPNSISVPR